MRPNLYSADLANVRLEDIAEFLGMGLPVDERPGEGARLDYKLEIPDDLGKDVAALGNSFGGLLFIGIDEDAGRPTQCIGNPRNPRSDLKTRLANMILSTIFPVPQFSIGVAEVVGAGPHEIAVIRVEAGPDTPYMWTKNRKNVVPVRMEDQSVAADPRQLMDLFSRGSHAEGTNTSPPLANIVVSPREGTGDNAKHRQIVSVSSIRPLAAPIDRLVEDRVRNAILTAYGDRTHLELRLRGVSQVEFESATRIEWFPQAWRFAESGELIAGLQLPTVSNQESIAAARAANGARMRRTPSPRAVRNRWLNYAAARLRSVGGRSLWADWPSATRRRVCSGGRIGSAAGSRACEADARDGHKSCRSECVGVDPWGRRRRRGA